MPSRIWTAEEGDSNRGMTRLLITNRGVTQDGFHRVSSAAPGVRKGESRLER